MYFTWYLCVHVCLSVYECKPLLWHSLPQEKMHFWSAKQLHYNLFYFIFVYRQKSITLGDVMWNFLPLSGVWYFFKLYEPLFQSSTDIDFHFGSDGHILCYPWYIGPPGEWAEQTHWVLQVHSDICGNNMFFWYVPVRCTKETRAGSRVGPKIGRM